jgi:hypothetical protein
VKITWFPRPYATLSGARTSIKILLHFPVNLATSSARLITFPKILRWTKYLEGLYIRPTTLNHKKIVVGWPLTFQGLGGLKFEGVIFGQFSLVHPREVIRTNRPPETTLVRLHVSGWNVLRISTRNTLTSWCEELCWNYTGWYHPRCIVRPGHSLVLRDYFFKLVHPQADWLIVPMATSLSRGYTRHRRSLSPFIWKIDQGHFFWRDSLIWKPRATRQNLIW